MEDCDRHSGEGWSPGCGRGETSAGSGHGKLEELVSKMAISSCENHIVMEKILDLSRNFMDFPSIKHQEWGNTVFLHKNGDWDRFLDWKRWECFTSKFSHWWPNLDQKRQSDEMFSGFVIGISPWLKDFSCWFLLMKNFINHPQNHPKVVSTIPNCYQGFQHILRSWKDKMKILLHNFQRICNFDECHHFLDLPTSHCWLRVILDSNMPLWSLIFVDCK